MKTRALVAIVSLAVAVTAPLSAQTVDQQLIAARDTVWRAFFHNDTALLRRFLPPAIATLEGANAERWSTRSEVMRDSRGFVQGKSRLVDVKFDDTQITMSGHSAVLRSSYMVLTENAGRVDTSRGRATELFVRQGKTWVNPYWQLESGARGVEREIPLPDTLGTNFALADTLSMKGAPTDYDAMLGTWEFRFQPRKPDGTYWAPFTGHWTFEKVPGGGVIEDHWRADDPEIPMAQTLRTYRTFDPKRRVWQMYGSNPRGGAVQPGLTWSDANYRYAIQRSGESLNRIRYEAITADYFLWRTDLSRDGGKTWLLDAGIMEARRIGK